MAKITDAKLNITHDRTRRTARAVVTCKVHFTAFEQCLMKACPKTWLFKLKCELWGKGVRLPIFREELPIDKLLYTYPRIKFFPDPTPLPFLKVLHSMTLWGKVFWMRMWELMRSLADSGSLISSPHWSLLKIPT